VNSKTPFDCCFCHLWLNNATYIWDDLADLDRNYVGRGQADMRLKLYWFSSAFRFALSMSIRLRAETKLDLQYPRYRIRSALLFRIWPCMISKIKSYQINIYHSAFRFDHGIPNNSQRMREGAFPDFKCSNIRTLSKRVLLSRVWCVLISLVSSTVRH